MEVSLETITRLIKTVEKANQIIQKQIEQHNDLIGRIERLNAEVGTLTLEVQALRKELDDTAREEHYHDEYASIDHIERSESSFNNQLSRLKDDLSNLEYRCSDIERKAENAQRTADEARRSSRGGW